MKRQFSHRRFARAIEPHTDSEVAEAIGKSRQTAARYRKGEIVPDADSLAAVAALTGKTVGYFFESGAVA